jgi:hypothetical protein
VTASTETTDAPPFEVKRLQSYWPCKTEYLWGETVHKPFVVTALDGDRIEVWDPTGGQRMGGSRWVARKNLHATGKTKHGKERRTGWRLHCEAPADPVKVELCGSCFTWKGRDEFAVLAHGFGHSTCKPCKVEIERFIDELHGSRR